jgi:hypothetical protein
MWLLKLVTCRMLKYWSVWSLPPPTQFTVYDVHCAQWYINCKETITGFIRGILRGVRYAKSLRVLFSHRRSPSWTTLVLYSRVVFFFNEPTKCRWKENPGNIFPVLEFLNNLWGARNQIGIGLSYRPYRPHRLGELIPWNRFLGFLIV